jgi:hypothetical protein
MECVVNRGEAQINGWDSLGSVLDCVSDGLLLLTREGHAIRANRPAYEMLGLDPQHSDPAQALDRLTSNASWRRDQIAQACGHDGALHAEWELPLTGECRRLELLLAPLRPDLVVGWMRDLTHPHALEREVELRAAYQEANARVLHAAARCAGFDALLDAALQVIGRARGVSRSYVFQHDPARGLMTCTHEWIAPGITPFLGLVAAKEDFPFWLSELQADHPIVANDICRDLPEELHEILRMQGILSILVVPLWVGGRLWGFLGLDECTARRDWTQLEVRLLRAFGELVARVIVPHVAPEPGTPAPRDLVLDHRRHGD